MENANLELLIADQLLEVLGGLLTPAAGELKAHWPQPWAWRGLLSAKGLEKSNDDRPLERALQGLA